MNEMEGIFNPLINIFDNVTGLPKILLLIVLVLSMLLIIYLIWKLTSFNSMPQENKVKEKKSKNTKVEVSQFSYIWLTIIFPVMVVIYIFFIA